MTLNNKVVLITGAGGGIGQTAVRKFVAEGAKVMLADITAESNQLLGSEHCACVTIDVSQDGQVNDMVNACVKRFRGNST